MIRMLAAAALTAIPGWMPSYPISAPTDRALGPELAVSPQAVVVMAVWDLESGPDCVQSPASLTCIHTVQAAQRRGPTWGAPLTLARPGIGARPTAAANDAGRAVVIWVHDIGRDRVVQATYRTATDASFPNPSDLSAAVLEVRDHHVGMDGNGNIAVVWAERHETDFDVAGDVLDVASGTWRAPIVLSSGPVRAGPDLAVSSRGVSDAVWIEGSSVKASRADLHVGTWEQPLTLSNNAGANVSVASNAAGDAVAAWALQNQPGIEVALHRYQGFWSAPLRIDDGSGVAATGGPDVGLASDGTFAAAWIDGRGALQAAVGPKAVRIAAGHPTDVRVAIDPHGNSVVIWRDGTRLFSAVRPVTAGWQPAELLSDAAASPASIALPSAGNGLAVWNAGSGEHVPAVAAELPPDWQPVLRNVTAPEVLGRARVGRTVTCDRDEWAGTFPIRYAYRWLRNGHARARGRTYRIKPQDARARLACRVSASNLAGVRSATSAPVRVKR